MSIECSVLPGVDDVYPSVCAGPLFGLRPENYWTGAAGGSWRWDLTGRKGVTARCKHASRCCALCNAGLYGAAEGISYLVVVGIIGWSIATKVQPIACPVATWEDVLIGGAHHIRPRKPHHSNTPPLLVSHAPQAYSRFQNHDWTISYSWWQVRTGSGLPAGPSGLLGAVEGFSYLTLVASIAAFTLTFLEKGSLPGVTG